MKRWFPIWIVPVLLVFAIGTVWLRLLAIRTTYDLNQVENEIQNVQREREQIALKVAALRSPRRLEQLAKTKFKLSPPKPGQTIYLQELK